MLVVHSTSRTIHRGVQGRRSIVTGGVVGGVVSAGAWWGWGVGGGGVGWWGVQELEANSCGVGGWGWHRGQYTAVRREEESGNCASVLVPSSQSITPPIQVREELASQVMFEHGHHHNSTRTRYANVQNMLFAFVGSRRHVYHATRVPTAHHQCPTRMSVVLSRTRRGDEKRCACAAGRCVRGVCVVCSEYRLDTYI